MTLSPSLCPCVSTQTSEGCRGHLRTGAETQLLAASGGKCKGDLPLKTPQRGSGKSEQLQ
jgi:hypothetical protein